MSVSACGGKNSDKQGAGTVDSANPLDLAQADITAMGSEDPTGGELIDAKYNGTFSSIFGGTSGPQILQYFQTRVHHLVDPNRVGFSPDNFANENWLKAPAPTTPPPAVNPEPDSGSGSPKYQVGALNIGTLYWLEGLVNQVPVSLQQLDGPTIPLDSSRVGIVILGDGYTATVTTEDGTVIPLPPEYRQAILLHEARHSDCTGGITEASLKVLRGLKDSSEYERAFDSMPCGHLHRVCKSGDLAGMAACDIEPWGAYTVGSIYALASYAGAQTPLNQAIFKAQFADQMARVQVDAKDLLEGKFGKPDMSSQGYSHDGPGPQH